MISKQFIFFDLGSTLEDETATYKDWAEKSALFLKKHSINTTSENILKLVREGTGRQIQNPFYYALDSVGLDKSLHAQMRLEIIWDKSKLRLYKNAKAVLEELSIKHTLGILANQSTGTLERLSAYGIKHYFSVIISSDEAGFSKPDPRIFSLAEEKTGMNKKNIWMIGDRLDNDIKPANLAGWNTIRILNGYSKFQTPENKTETPDFTVSDLTGIINFINKDYEAINMPANNSHAQQYAQVSNWQYEKGKKLLGFIQHRNNETILDLGCGTGELTFNLAELALPFNGKIIATDPDADRLKVAKEHQPKNLNNVTFFKDSAENLENVKSNSIDVVFSNYVIHWIKNKKNMLSELHRCLRPDRYCILQFMESMPLFEKEITLLTGTAGKDLIGRYHCLNKEEWIELFSQFNFTVDYIELPVLQYNFPSLDAYFDWWEATTNGAFLRTNIPEVSIKSLYDTYSGEIKYHGTTIQTVILKP